jgi:hypothetical protein
MDEREKKVLEDVARFGWHVIIVPASNAGPAFAYTIGLFKSYGHPEIIIFGLSNDQMHALLNLVGQEVKVDRKYSANEFSPDFIEEYNCAFLDFPKESYNDFLGYALWFYKGNEFPVLQFVWPDKNGKFPWNEDVEPEIKELQPILGMLPREYRKK